MLQKFSPYNFTVAASLGVPLPALSSPVSRPPFMSGFLPPAPAATSLFDPLLFFSK